MTDTTDPDVLAPEAEAPEDNVAEENPEALDAEAGRSSDPLAKVRREAAGYRVKLRESVLERDRLAGVVESMQRAEAERTVTGNRIGALAEGSDLWRGGVALSELLAEDGTLDSEKVEAARGRVLAERPHWGSRGDDYDGGARQTSVPADHAGALSERLRRAGGL